MIYMCIYESNCPKNKYPGIIYNMKPVHDLFIDLLFIIDINY